MRWVHGLMVAPVIFGATSPNIKEISIKTMT
jgi:hypothetical protein